MRLFLASFFGILLVLMLFLIEPISDFFCKITGWKKPQITAELEKRNIIVRTIIIIGVRNCIINCGNFCICIAIIVFGLGFFTLGSFIEPNFDELKPVYGNMIENGSGRHRGVKITDRATNKMYFLSDIIYGNCEKDLGKPVKALVHKNTIYQIEINSIIKRPYSVTLDSAVFFFTIGKVTLALGILIHSIAVFLKLKEKNTGLKNPT